MLSRIKELEDALAVAKRTIVEGGGGGVICTVWVPEDVCPAETLVDHIDAVLSSKKASSPFRSFQQWVGIWMQKCFGPKISADRLERGDRFLEEVFELLQSGGYPPERVDALRQYVWSRAVGEPSQEVGGVMITLAAYCLAHELDMYEAGQVELARISTPETIAKIRAKQAAKPTGSALPMAFPTP